MKRFVEKKAGVFEPVNPNCTCYDRASSKCVPQQICTSCNAFPDSPNCNYRVGNRLVPRYQTPIGGNIYATPTNRFRNAVELMPLGTPSGGFGMPMGNSGRDSYQNAVGMGNPTMVAPAFGGTQTPSALAINSRKCMKACNKTGLQGVFIDGKCYCTEHQVYGEWVKTHFNFNNAIGGCHWLLCPEGYTRRDCRCVQNEDLPKKVKKKLGLDFSNFLNNPFAKKTTAMTDKKCKRICDRSQHQAVLVDGNCICASVNDIADFQKDKGFHNAVSGRACREQVRCPNGYEAKMVGLDCQCVKKAENVSAAFRVNNLR